MKQKMDPLHSFTSLPPEVESKLREQLNVRTFSAGEAVFLQGAPPSAVYLVASGRLKVVRVTPEGYESVLCVRGPGDYLCPVPLLDGGDHLGSAFAMTDVTLFWVGREAFLELCQESAELLAVVQGDCLSEVRHLLNRLEAFAFRSVRERLAIALLDERRHSKTPTPHTNEIRLTQQELAGLIGASRESVSRVLKQLEERHIVALGRGKVTIKDMERMHKIAGERMR
jgi:CRP-like cAMP-binding protein